MKVRVCMWCGAVSFVWWDEETRETLLGGSFCGCPGLNEKYRQHEVHDGVLVVMDEEPA